jgi:hypothetical protein
VERRAGRPLSVGRKTRSIPPALRRALRTRDRGCRFPGCTSSCSVDAHHIEHWADGGATSLDNLVELCHHHHRLLHEGDYTVSTSGTGFVFRRPDGRELGRGPAPTTRLLRPAARSQRARGRPDRSRSDRDTLGRRAHAPRRRRRAAYVRAPEAPGI